MEIGLGDEPDYSLEELKDMIISASLAFADALESLTVMFLQHLEQMGIELNSSGDIRVNL